MPHGVRLCALRVSVVKTSSILRWFAFIALMFAAMARAQSIRARIPYWDLDPTLVDMPETALLYSHGFALDSLVWLAAAAMIVGELLIGRRIHWKSGLLVLLGAIGAALHGYVLPPPGATTNMLHGDFMGLALGSAWASAVVGGWTLLHLAREQGIRRAAAFTLLGFVATLVAKGAYQVYVEHAYTVKSYRADPAAVLASNGLEIGSTAAKEFERRLLQPEALGWFGLANVFGSFVAAGFVLFLALSIGAWKLVREKAITSGPAGVVTIALLISAFGLYLSGSKGAIGAALAGCVALLPLLLRAGRGEEHVARTRVGLSQPLSLWERMSRSFLRNETGEGAASTTPESRLPTPVALLPIALCLLTLLAILVRGVVGERIHELSLLFRYHYLVAATRIFASDPLTGVGPMGFKGAYALHKVPINPEQVESPHSVFFDWSATLGLFGVAWCLFLIYLLYRAGRNLTSSPPGATSLSPGREQVAMSRLPIYASIVAIVLAAIVCWLREAPVVTQDEWPLRLVALVVWSAIVVIGMRIADLAPRAFNVAIIAAATTLAVHGMIEMTPTQPGSCMLWLLVIGCSASSAYTSSATHAKRSVVLSVITLQVSLVACVATLSFAYPIAKVKREEMLKHAANGARTAALIDALRQHLDDPSARQQLEDILRQEAIKRPGNWEQQQPGSLNAWAMDVRATLFSDVRSGLDFVSGIDTDHGWFYEHAGSSPLTQAFPLVLKFQLLELAASGNTELMKTLRLTSDRVADPYGRSASILASAASYFEAVAVQLNDVSFRRIALTTWQRVIKLDPYSVSPALNAYRVSRQLGYTRTAYEMAELVLRNNDYLRLDPLKQLPAEQKAEIEQFMADNRVSPPVQNPAGP